VNRFFQPEPVELGLVPDSALFQEDFAWPACLADPEDPADPDAPVVPDGPEAPEPDPAEPVLVRCVGSLDRH